jgi:hypothetical protein
MHSCDNRICVNPLHLKLGTHSDNSKDASLKGRMARGERQGGAKLKEQDILDILQLSKNGMSQGQIAKRYIVQREAIREILKGRSWAWLTKL